MCFTSPFNCRWYKCIIWSICSCVESNLVGSWMCHCFGQDMLLAVVSRAVQVYIGNFVVFISTTYIHHGPSEAAEEIDAFVQDFRLLHWHSWGVHSSGMLHSIGWQLVPSILGQPNIPYSVVQSSPKRNFVFLFLFRISPLCFNFQENLLKIFIFIHEYLCEKDEDCQPWECLVMPCHTIDMIWYCLAKLLQTWTCCSPWRWKKNCS